jgi:hypothetical protein
MDNG